eukprot:m.402025 g.402025  ORF g.402025 m.402025 type:complete len:66 (+) comp21170_c1_seq30:111-308(+)
MIFSAGAGDTVLALFGDSRTYPDINILTKVVSTVVHPTFIGSHNDVRKLWASGVSFFMQDTLLSR